MNPIGILDSGIGGLTVMCEIQRLLPGEDILYLADTANFPYGEKSPEEIVRCTRKSAKLLYDKKIKLLLLACHTATCHALTTLQAELPIPVLGMIEPSVSALKEINSFALLATTSTIQSGMYQTLLHPAKILPVACPLLVPLIEKNLPLNAVLRHYLSAIFKQNITTVFLACTHYPFIYSIFQKILGPNIQIIDPAQTCAKLVQKTLFLLNLQNLHIHSPRYEFLTSDSTNISFKTLLQKLEEKIEIVK